jgi:hypothetical protein
MTQARQLHLAGFMRRVSIHTAWWRYPGALADANFNFATLAPGFTSTRTGCT